METRHLDDRDRMALEQCGLSEGDLNGCRAMCYAPAEAVLQQGLPMHALYLVTAGTAVVQVQMGSGKILTLCKHGSGDILGDVEFMTERTAATTTVLAEACLRCVEIPLPENKSALKANAPFLNQVGRTLAEKLLHRGNAQTVTALAPAEARLCSYILQTAQNGIFREPLAETARMLGISYRHIFRLLHALCTGGLLEHRTNGYCILQPELLALRAEQTP